MQKCPNIVEQNETSDEFPENVGLSQDDYLKALQTSVTTEKICFWNANLLNAE